MLGTAAMVEIAAFYIPGVDNLLDTVATPGAVIAGTIVSAAVMTDLPPMVKWTAAIIAGGGVAGITQGLTAMLRAKSTVFTGGLGNSAVATAELGSASLISLLALAAPLAALGLVILFFWLAFRLLRGLARGSHRPNEQYESQSSRPTHSKATVSSKPCRAAATCCAGFVWAEFLWD